MKYNGQIKNNPERQIQMGKSISTQCGTVKMQTRNRHHACMGRDRIHLEYQSFGKFSLY